MKLLSSLISHDSILKTGGLTNTKCKLIMKVQEYYIELQEPDKVWIPNDIISGQIVLYLKKDIKDIRLNLSLVGELKIKNGLSTTSKYKLCETLFNKSICVYGDTNTRGSSSNVSINGLTKGRHLFPFRMKIPQKNIYTSIDFEKGSISYHILSTLELIAYPYDSLKCSKKFSVLVPISVDGLPGPTTKTVILKQFQTVRRVKSNLNNPDAPLNSIKKASQSVSTNSFKTVTMSVDLSASGFVIGDKLPIKVYLQHYKEYSHPAGLIATLVRICRFKGNDKNNPVETYRKDICQCVSPLFVNEKSHDYQTIMNLKIPLDAFPTISLTNECFSFQYYIEVLANLSNKNIIFTESNRVVGGCGVGDIPATSLKQDTTLSILSKKIKDVTLDSQNTTYDESLIFFEDLINVEKLKKLKNVIGMFIEVVIGTDKKSPNNLESEVFKESTNDIQPSPRNLKEYNSNFNIYSLEPVPSYTPNTQYQSCDDKNELELQRLQNLESEPPVDYL